MQEKNPEATSPRQVTGFAAQCPMESRVGEARLHRDA